MGPGFVYAPGHGVFAPPSHDLTTDQLRGMVTDLTVSGDLFDDGFFSSGHYDVLSEGAYLHLRSKVVVQNNIIIT